MKDRKIIVVFIVLLISIILLIGVSYSFFNYQRRSTKNHSVVAGGINLTYNEETDTLAITSAFPETKEEARARNDNYITFTISGKNGSSNDINYEIDLIHGDNITGKNRFLDEHIKFDLEETIGGNTKLVVDNMSYDDLSEYLSIWVNKVEANTTSSITRTYKLRMWISDKVIVSDSDPNASYSTSEYEDLYASVKIRVIGDFGEHDFIKNAYQTLLYNAVRSDRASEFVTNANGIDFGQISSDTNGKGLYYLSGTENDTYPIVFFRGAVTNNNVIFGGFCWQMVRTTDTGGIKMIYNGVATGNGTTCENTSGSSRSISQSRFNNNYSSMSDVGYMYNQRYAHNTGESTTNAYFGKEVEYDDFDSNGTNEYRLVSGTTSQTLDATHHYTCNLTNDTGTCTTIRYYYYINGETYYYISLTDGDLIEDAIYKMTGNGSSEVRARNSGYVLNNINSTIKTNLETWFSNNLNDYLDYLEDTTWCNYRTFASNGTKSLASSGFNPNGGSLSNDILFETRNKIVNSWYSTTNIPSTTCENVTDQFRVGNDQAPLNYPIGLLTAEEAIMGGAASIINSNYTFYLYDNNNNWLASPSSFGPHSMNIPLGISGTLNSHSSNNYNYIRPAVSLALGTEFVDSGDGTPTNPYVVKMN